MKMPQIVLYVILIIFFILLCCIIVLLRSHKKNLPLESYKITNLFSTIFMITFYIFNYITNNCVVYPLLKEDLKYSNFVRNKYIKRFFTLLFLLISYIYILMKLSQYIFSIYGITISGIFLILPLTLTWYINRKITNFRDVESTKLFNNFNKNYNRLFWFLCIIQLLFYGLLIFKNRLLGFADEVLLDTFITVKQVYTLEMKQQYILDYLTYLFNHHNINNLNIYNVLRKYGAIININENISSIKLQLDEILNIYFKDLYKGYSTFDEIRFFINKEEDFTESGEFYLYIVAFITIVSYFFKQM